MRQSNASVRDVPPAELTACLQWLLPHVAPPRAHWIVAQIADRVGRKRLADIVSVESRLNGQVTGAAITLLQPSAAATLLAIHDDNRLPEGRFARESAVLNRLLERLGPSGVRFLQASADSSEDAIALKDLGFEEIAQLVFLVLDAESMMPAPPPSIETTIEFKVVGHDERLLEIACEVAARSFLGTQDCPRLSEFRSAIEIVNGYKNAATFDPTIWRILMSEGEPAGCLFLTAHRASPESPEDKNTPSGVIEIGYMGLVPECRGIGLGKRILAEAYQIARGRNAARMVLAVDSENSPALSLYRRQGWIEASGESVWGMRICS